MTDAVLGIDVSKNNFDAGLGAGTKVRSKSFTNSSDGWHQLIAWLGEHKIGRVGKGDLIICRRIISISNSTRSMPREKPARPISKARRMKAGASFPITTTTAVSRAPPSTARHCKTSWPTSGPARSPSWWSIRSIA